MHTCTHARLPEEFGAVLHLVGGARSPVVAVVEPAPSLEVAVHEAAGVARAAVDHVGVPHLRSEVGKGREENKRPGKVHKD